MNLVWFDKSCNPRAIYRCVGSYINTLIMNRFKCMYKSTFFKKINRLTVTMDISNSFVLILYHFFMYYLFYMHTLFGYLHRVHN